MMIKIDLHDTLKKPNTTLPRTVAYLFGKKSHRVFLIIYWPQNTKQINLFYD